MIAASYRDWPPGELSCQKHEQLLTDLLSERAAGRAWLACLPTSLRTEAPAPTTASGGSTIGDDAESRLDPAHWDQGTHRVAGLVTDLRNRCSAWLRGDHRGIGMADAFLSLRHRVFLDRPRLEHLIARLPASGPSWTLPGPDDDFFVCVDLRFDSLLDATGVCHVAVSVWSGPPWSRHHRPDGREGVPPPRGPVPDPEDADLLRRSSVDLFRAAARGVERIVDARHTATVPRVFDRPYRPPVFWVAAPARPDPEPWGYLADCGHLRIRDLTETVLDGATADDRLVAASVIRRTLVLRRFAPVSGVDDDVPIYLFLPAAPRAPAIASDSSEEAHDRWRHGYAAQEDDIRRAVTALTRLEAQAASSLFDIETDLTIRSNHLRLFHNAVERAAGIWDGLATHLPTEHGARLERIHRSIELLHQSLLQGLADIDRISPHVFRISDRLAELSDRLETTFDDALLEAARAGVTPVSRTIVSAGHFAEIQRRSDAARSEAEQITGAYRSLLDAITTAFDERRVRETDRIQKSGARLAAALGVVGVVTVLDTILDSHYTVSGPWLWIYRSLLGAVGAAIFVLLVAWWWRTRGIGRLARTPYERLHREIADFLRHCSTDRLVSLQKEIEHRAPTVKGVDIAAITRASEERRDFLAARWRWHDEYLTQWFAAVWDAVDCYSDAVPGAITGRPRRGDEGTAHRGDVRVEEQEHRSVDDRRARWSRAFEPPGEERLSVGRRRAQTRRAREVQRRLHDDAASLHAMAEKWSLRTLLITERPRDLWKFGLPHLTVMYRVTFVLLGREGVDAITTTDLRLVFGKIGVDRSRAPRLIDWADSLVATIAAEPDGRRAQTLRARVRADFDRTAGLSPPRG